MGADKVYTWMKKVLPKAMAMYATEVVARLWNIKT